MNFIIFPILPQDCGKQSNDLMKIVIDEKIPFIRGVFEPWAEVVYTPGKMMDRDMVSDADALIIRTRTKCNSALLSGSSVKFIASATIGFDHIDARWLEENGIRWSNAPGCNSGSVMQYITAALFFLAEKHSLDLRSLTIGVVGVGNVGSKVVRAAEALGMKVLRNDPPRKRREKLNDFVSLEKILQDSDIVTLHVPLTLEGHDRTHYLINRENLTSLKKDAFLINTSRGEVVDNTALRKVLTREALGGTVLDVWEGEPDADRRLLSMAELATPHIAGYSVDGKANATIASVRAVASELGLPLTDWKPEMLPLPETPEIDLTRVSSHLTPLGMVAVAVKHTYPVTEDDSLFRKSPEKFEYHRDNYRIRREFSSYVAITEDEDTSTILSSLGFNIRKFRTE